MNISNYERHVELLGSSEKGIRAQAFAFFQAQGKTALDALIAGTHHANWRVRRSCADLMDHLADNRCVPSLIRLLGDPIAGVRRLALHALSCQGCKTCPLDVDIVGLLITQAVSDSSVRVQRVAVHQLGCQPPDARAATFLRALLQQKVDAGIASRARWALTQQAK